MLTEMILGALGEAIVTHIGSKGFAWLKSRDAKEELASIAANAIEAAISEAPSLAEDLRSESFVKQVIVPTLQALVSDPSQLPDPERLADQYVKMFVERFARNDGVDAALSRIFQTEPTDLNPAFVNFFRELRSRLYQSKHWRELGHLVTTEATFKNTETIISVLEGMAQRHEADAIDLDRARQDARSGSDELRNWPRAISGHELTRPELERLKTHILAEASAATLLIGEAGSGKSALLAKLTEELENRGSTVFGIKADTLPADVATFDDIARALGMTGSLLPELSALARNAPVVLIIDQLDAVSDVMDRTSQRMKVLLRLVRQAQEQRLPVHVVVSSRPFEAAHDARFQQLRAEEFHLALPAVEAVQAFLTDLGIDWSDVPQPLWQTLRRPFALKLFVEVIQRGASPSSVDSGSLLDRWLATAQLGTDPQRQDVLQLMDRLAGEMLETETLWRPMDAYEAAHKDALVRAEACGLVVRSGAKIGFCHQSWLDDFQAKSFKTGKDLAEYTWRNQDSLFVRATVLRSLERLRQIDPEAYHRAVSALLWSTTTRRHVKHLVVDVVSTSANPSDQEGAWVETLIRDDPILANRAFGKITERWSSWRAMLRKCLSTLMKNEEFQWRATQGLAAEAKEDPDYVVDLIRRHWSQPDQDGLVFRVAEQSGVLTPAVEQLISEILSRTAIDPYAVSHFVTTLRAEQRYAEACRLVGLWFDTQEIDNHKDPTLHAVEKLAQEAPLEFAEALLPRFLAIAKREVAPYYEGYKRFPKAKQLPWDWDFDRDRDSVLKAFRDAMKAVAAARPHDALRLIRELEAIEIDQVQDVVAQTFIAGSAALAGDAFAFLMADERRLQIGDAHVNLEPGLSSTESGLSSQELVEAIAPQLSEEVVGRLRDRIESWSLYGPEFGKDDEPRTRLQRLKWADQHRMELLERLPDRFLSARRRRQINEWRAAQRHPIPRRRAGVSMATFVGSPMSHEKMARARDEDIFAILDEINDEAPERSRRRRISMDGGVTELSRAFGAFAKENPERAVALCEEKFAPGRHEHAAAQMVEELSKLEGFSAERLLALIHELSERGFASRTWKTFSSWALARLAGKLSGLPDETIELLESWLENDPTEIAEKIDRRLAMDAENERRNAREKTVPDPIVFASHRLGGMRIVPQDNYSILDAIFHGLIGRDDRAFDQWLTILERHAARAEDPHIWSFLLLSEGRWLYWADRERVRQLLADLWKMDERVFLSVDLGGTLWSSRAMIPEELMTTVIKAWSASGGEDWRQAAAELAEAYRLTEPTSTVSLALTDVLLDEPSPELTGRLFTAASAWQDSDTDLRKTAHTLLMTFVSKAQGDQAHAISSAVDRTDTLQPDEMTKELILQIAENAAVLGASLTGRFADGLQSLLLYPGFDDPVMQVTERVAELIIDKKGGKSRGFIDKDFVQVAIALQRNDGPLRSRAMDVYEKLLDAGAYGAEEAAKDVIGR
ncbi:ATP-binding protein [Altererythrobacter sp. CC-YST694]|uniref:AAA family ATPase n=1 Tax=Altererythrobacter sp. CC-YST694 TaxID=2755038 RepID=UPI001D035D89|nr:ATP-binding protein [Altererythrobacter sp. CC-YST694]MCB5423780.1 ATP-binding protein [Altererythrobacter sp. CC-YST694]